MAHRDVKVCLLGSQAVGKTSITNRFVNGVFRHDYVSTIGAAFSSRRFYHQDMEFRFALWDTAGEEKFRSLAPITYRGATAALLVYDITNQQSFEDVNYWMSELRRKGPEDISILIVGNKIDLESKRTINEDRAQQYAQSKGVSHFRTSAKSGKGVEKIFVYICEILSTKQEAKNDYSSIRRHSTVHLENTTPNNKDNACPC